MAVLAVLALVGEASSTVGWSAEIRSVNGARRRYPRGLKPGSRWKHRPGSTPFYPPTKVGVYSPAEKLSTRAAVRLACNRIVAMIALILP
jgi:hypothetical protein